MTFLHSIPESAAAALVVVVCVAASLAGFVAARKLFPVDVPEERKGIAMAILSVVATANALLVAFAAVYVWESHNGADQAVTDEANTASELGRDLAVFDSEASYKARGLLRTYIEDVINQEWPAMAKAAAVEHAWEELDALFRGVAALEPDTPRRQVFLPEIFQRMNELVKNRRMRVFAATSEVPGMLWAVVIFSTLITLALMYVFPLDRFHGLLIAAYAASMGLVFFFIFEMDYPFSGPEGVGPSAFEATLDGMSRWDKEVGR